MSEQTEAPEVDAWEAWAACTDRCSDPSMHEHFTSGRSFHWCWPKFDRMTGAQRVTRLMLNRYPHNVIGVALYVRGHGFGLRWKGSPKRRAGFGTTKGSQ